MEKLNSEVKFWPYFAVATVSVIILAAIRWSFAHPYGIHWDESLYINEANVDLQRLMSGRLLNLVRRILMESSIRPPAYRVFSLPFLVPFGYHTTLARLSSLACFGLSARFVYLATRRFASQTASAFAALIFALSPEVISASIFFSTDAPLYLAISAMFYYLFVYWTETVRRSATWIGLGLAIGLGFLSKTSFAAIVVPVFAFVLFENFRKHLGLRGLAPIAKAGALGFIVAAPWWFLHFRSALEYAQFARSTVRNSLGAHSLSMLARWCGGVFVAVLGPCVGILFVVLMIAWIQKAFARKGTTLEPLRRSVLGVCACGAIPIVLTQLTSTNHLLRYLTPPVIPLAIMCGVLASSMVWATSRITQGFALILFCTQLGMIVYPVVIPNKQPVEIGLVNGTLPWRTMARFEQWDWSAVRDISQTCGIASPKISFLGATRTLNPPAIEFPWVVAATSTHQRDFDFAEPTWLWQYEEGSPDWQKLMNSAEQSDIVVTAPNYRGEPGSVDQQDNQYDVELADRLSSGGRFRKPIHLEMGRFVPVDVVVFVKNTIACSPGTEFHASN
jgi:4-amino-4-deoxy-L-arabinose transferase-like glycosyltransferase